MTYTQIMQEGLWKNNVGFVQLIGLCSLLAVTTTATSGLGLGIATTFVLIASNTTISLVRRVVPNDIRLPIFVLIIASFVTATEMVMKAFYYDLYLVLGIFLPLIVVNCAVIGRAEAFASKNPINYAFVDGLMMGIGFTFALMMLGGLRELLGYGTLFAQAEMMFGKAATLLEMTIFTDYQGFLLAILPPGAFFGLGLLIALKNWLDKKAKKSVKKMVIPIIAESQLS